jgi:hypothetical protein
LFEDGEWIAALGDVTLDFTSDNPGTDPDDTFIITFENPISLTDCTKLILEFNSGTLAHPDWNWWGGQLALLGDLDDDDDDIQLRYWGDGGKPAFANLIWTFDFSKADSDSGNLTALEEIVTKAWVSQPVLKKVYLDKTAVTPPPPPPELPDGVTLIEAEDIDFSQDDGSRAGFPTASIMSAGEMPKYLLLSVGDESGNGIGGLNIAFNSSDGWKQTNVTTADWTNMSVGAGVFIIDLSQCDGYGTVGLSGGWLQFSMWIGAGGKTEKTQITGAAFVDSGTDGATATAALCVAGNQVEGATILWYVSAASIEDVFE